MAQYNFSAYLEKRAEEPLFHERPEASFQAIKRELTVNQDDSNNLSTASTSARRVPAFIPIITWIVLSGSVILFNSHILSSMGFDKPITLTFIHAAFQTAATRILRSRTSLVDGAKDLEASGKMTLDFWVKSILPIGLCFSASLILSNWVYLRLTVSYIQMLKAGMPIVILCTSILFKLKSASRRQFGTVALISFGVLIASYGEFQFDLAGTLVQLLALVVESFRLVMIEKLLHGYGLSPLTSLYYFAPIVAATNFILIIPLEGLEAFTMALKLGPLILLSNASLTLGLNLASVWLIASASGLILTLSGVIKDILLVTASWAVLGSTVTIIQIGGYAIALLGMVAFKLQG